VIIHFKFICQLLVLTCIFVISGQVFATERDNISIGVLAYDGKQQALVRWQPTANYLAQHIQSNRFKLVRKHRA
jgi:hypothetical protein